MVVKPRNHLLPVFHFTRRNHKILLSCTVQHLYQICSIGNITTSIENTYGGRRERQSSLAHLCEWRDYAKLLDHSEPVSDAPMSHQLAIRDTEDVDPHLRDLLSCGMDVSERALVGA